MYKGIILFVVMALGFSQAQKNSIDIDDLLKNLPEGTLPEGFSGDKPDLTAIVNDNPTFKIILEKCSGNSSTNETLTRFMKESTDMFECVKKQIDFDIVQEEIEKAKPKGELDVVFKKYCQRSSLIKTCVNNFMKTFETCLSEDERPSLDVISNIIDKIANFTCFKDGDRIALFISEKGIECFTSQKEGIEQCSSATFGNWQLGKDKDLNLTSLTIKPDDLKPLLFTESHCNQLHGFSECVVNKLEECPMPTPANIFESMFKFAMKSSPCSEFSPPPSTSKRQGDPNSGINMQTSLFTLATTIFAAILF